MSLAAGTRLGPYEITAKLGEGGMGEVYRATDTRLRRDVAIKVLPAAFTADRERLARFEREAQLLAQLHHPNIASIFGLEEADGARALVLELVEGATLAERLDEGPLPVADCVTIAVQIARALETAHEKGIVHRDLKPQNVKLAADGTVKVLDFGLAKAMDPPASAPPSSSQLAMSPTITFGATAQGVILGTAAYMAPEQARGLTVDKRADVWAFGVVLYELLTGRVAFAGDTVPDVLAAVLTREIDWSVLPAATPPALRRLLRRCLERNPKNRLHDVADARIVLDEIAAGRSDEPPTAAAAAPVAAPARRSAAARALPWLAGLAVGALVVGVADRTLLAPPPPVPPRFVALTHSGTDLGPSAAPDGRSVAFTSTRDGRSRIWLKQLATGEEVALTSGPSDTVPVFSPDGSSILFLRGSTQPFTLFRVSAVGGEPRRVTEGVASWATWSPDGRSIAVTRAVGSASLANSIAILSPEGSEERELVRVSDLSLFHLRFSPDGRTVGAWGQLPTNFAGQQSVVGFDVASGARTTLYQPAPGTVLYGWTWNGPREILVAESVTQSGRGGSRLLRVRLGGGDPETLLWLRQPSTRIDIQAPGRLVVDQQTNVQNLALVPLTPAAAPAPAATEARRWLTRGASADRQPAFSPDGRRLVFNSDRGGNLDVWELDLATSAVRPLTVAASDDWDPAFTADGRQLLWSSNRSGNYEIWRAASDGSGARKVSADGVDAENPSITPDGRWIVYVSANPAQNGVWKIRPDGTGAERLAAGVLTISELSPDGRWVAFIDLEKSTLRVVALADASPIAEIALPSIPFGFLQLGRSRWIPGSSTLVWVDFDVELGLSRIVAQEIAAGRDTRATRRTLAVGTPDELLESFAVSPDGTHLVLATLRSGSELMLVEGLPDVAP